MFVAAAMVAFAMTACCGKCDKKDGEKKECCGEKKECCQKDSANCEKKCCAEFAAEGEEHACCGKCAGEEHKCAHECNHAAAEVVE